MSPNARAYHAADIAQFASSSVAAILGNLAADTDFDIELAQRNAWSEQIPILKTPLSGIEGSIFLEFVVPRIGSRIDAVLVSGPVLFVIEFKVGAEAFSRDDLNQVWDYALDLKNFHRESYAAAIVLNLIATHASRSDVVLREAYSDGVYPPVTSNRDGLSHLLVEGLRSVKGTPIDAVAWSRSPYQPTPTIIEAARALYSRHSVEDISRHDAGARNLRVTSQRIDELIEEARNDFDASARTLPRQGGDKQRTEDAFHESPYPSVGGCGIRLLRVSGGAIRRNRCGRGAPRPTARASAPRPGRRSIGPRGRSRPHAGRRPPSDSGRRFR